MRFQLIDRVLEREPDRLVATKCVTNAEEYLADHFPGFPVLPGVLMLEALVQAGRILLQGGGLDGRHHAPSSFHSGETQSGPAGEVNPPDAALVDTGQAVSAAPLVLADVRSVRYGNMVRPGQTLQVEVKLRSRSENEWGFSGVGTVDGQVAVQGRFKLVGLTCTADNQ